ncbi:metallophosphoesterase [Dendrosporobacter sp. 1207_IL3150]|uniref:metallophosphoesterase n=1 Tax=Dendrosporobacter sp. 1207_IL3150 TaxID=3084054 RepID=UPI002FDA799F
MRGPSMISLLIAFLLLVAISWLVYRLLKKAFPMFAEPFYTRLYWAFSMLTIACIGSIRMLQPGAISPVLIKLAFVWLMGQIIILFFSPVFYIISRWLAARRDTMSSVPQASRRAFLKTVAGTLPMTALGLSSYGVFSGGSSFVLQRHELFLATLPAHLDNLKIIQLSDTHIGAFFSVDNLEEVLSVVKRENPDLLVITGDLIDDLTLLQPTMDKLNEITSELKFGVYFSWGNHEYFRDISKVRKALTNTSINVLTNSSKLLDDKGQSFYLLGVDYPWADSGYEQVAKREDMFNKAMQGVPENAFKILLSHHPDFIHNAFDAGIPLTLTGHTHGGQVALMGKSLLPVKYKYMRGLYQKDNSYGYVSTGTGSWFPFRVGCPAEVTIFTLRRKSIEV